MKKILITCIAILCLSACQHQEIVPNDQAFTAPVAVKKAVVQKPEAAKIEAKNTIAPKKAIATNISVTTRHTAEKANAIELKEEAKQEIKQEIKETKEDVKEPSYIQRKYQEAYAEYQAKQKALKEKEEAEKKVASIAPEIKEETKAIEKTIENKENATDKKEAIIEKEVKKIANKVEEVKQEIKVAEKKEIKEPKNPKQITLTELIEMDSESETIEKAIADGADVFVLNENNANLLMIAGQYTSRPDVITLLIDKGMDINAVDANGKTALIWAAEYTAFPKVIDVLLEKDANVKIKDSSGKTALEYAKGNPNVYGTSTYKVLRHRYMSSTRQAILLITIFFLVLSFFMWRRHKNETI